MKTRLNLALALMAAGTLFVLPAAYGYSGTLTWDATEAQLNASDGTSWASPATSLTWMVTQSGSVWDYKYLFSVPAKNVSHFILETSRSIVLGQDIFNYNLTGAASPVGPDTYTATDQGASNSNMPLGGIYGIKFITLSPGSTSWSVAFTSTHRPVWGDFYARCGSQDGEFNTVFNSGFTGGFFDPNDVVNRNGISTDSRLAVPDTMAVPETSSLVSALAGFPAMLALRFRRKK